MKTLLREPLVQFLLLGVLLFGVHRVLGGDLFAGAEDAPLIVDEQLARWIASSEARSQGRTPTEEEVAAAVQRYARMEALRREARRLGLDEGDPIVERRLEQKMEFLLEGAAVQPGEDELVAWLAEHPDDYAQDAIVGIEHRYFTGDDAAARAVADEAGEPPAGDPFLGGPRARGTAAQLDARFGPGFGQAVLAVEGDGWSAPIPSAYGVHRVRVLERLAAKAPALDDVRERVRRDVVAARAEAERERRIDELVAAMEVRIEADLGAAAKAATP